MSGGGGAGQLCAGSGQRAGRPGGAVWVRFVQDQGSAREGLGEAAWVSFVQDQGSAREAMGTRRGSAPFPEQRVVRKFCLQLSAVVEPGQIGADRASHQHVLLEVHSQAVGIKYML